MKKIWTILLSVLGFSHNSFAGCYDEAIKYSNDESLEYNIEHCISA